MKETVGMDALEARGLTAVSFTPTNVPSGSKWGEMNGQWANLDSCHFSVCLYL